MLRPGAVTCMARKAMKAKRPGGLYGLFAATDDDCDTVWLYLSDFADLNDGRYNTVQREIIFDNGARVRVFDTRGRTYYGLRFDEVLCWDNTLLPGIAALIKLPSSQPEPVETRPTPVFGL